MSVSRTKIHKIPAISNIICHTGFRFLEYRYLKHIQIAGISINQHFQVLDPEPKPRYLSFLPTYGWPVHAFCDTGISYNISFTKRAANLHPLQIQLFFAFSLLPFATYSYTQSNFPLSQNSNIYNIMIIPSQTNSLCYTYNF